MNTSIARPFFVLALAAFLQQGISFGVQASGSADKRNSTSTFGPLYRATTLIGTNLRNTQNEKLGVIKDFGVTLPDGRAPYTIFLSGGFFGVGERLIAAPTTALQKDTSDNMITLNMNRQQLKAAPGFDKNNWPEMSDPRWQAQVYNFYDQLWSSNAAPSVLSQNPQVNESAGAPISSSTNTGPSRNEKNNKNPSPDRTPRRGLGAEDLTGNDIKSSRDFFEKSGAPVNESAGASATPSAASPDWQRANQESIQPSAPNKIWRATDLIGTEVRNPQNQRVGEIKDVVLDMKSGRVAYTLISAGSFLGSGDKLYAVPSMSFSKGPDERTLILNTDKATLKAAPSIEKNDWQTGSNEEFTAEVYRYYHQQPYWHRGAALDEPSGAPQSPNSDIHNPNWEKSYNNNGETKNQIPAEDSSGTPVHEPSGAEPERTQNNQSPAKNQPDEDTGTASKESAELNATGTIKEPSGTSTGVNSSEPISPDEAQASSADRALSQRVRAALSNDTVLSEVAPNLQVSARNGRITLRGSVASQQEKEAIGTRAAEIVGRSKVDNQLQVSSKNSSPTP